MDAYIHTYIYISMPACAHTHINTQKIHTHRFMSTHTQINREIIKIKMQVALLMSNKSKLSGFLRV